jgi:peptide/nickel transport system substrate-binding protein
MSSAQEYEARCRAAEQGRTQDVIYAPTGFFLAYQAWRKNVGGIVKGPLPFFWGVSKAV